MRVVMLMIFLGLWSFAQSLVVKDAGVVVALNGKEMGLVKAQKLELQAGDSVRFVAGEGRVIIGDIQLVKANDSYSEPLPKSFDARAYVNRAKSAFVALFDKAKPVAHDGVSLKGNLPKIQKAITLRGQKYVEIIHNHFSPPPITLTILDANALPTQRLVSKSRFTFFRVDVQALGDGYSLVITNKEGDELAIYEIIEG